MGRKPIGKTAQKNLPPEQRNSRAFAFRVRKNAGHMESMVRHALDTIYATDDIDTTDWMVNTLYKGLKGEVETESEILDDILAVRDDMIVIRDEMANQVDKLIKLSSGSNFFAVPERKIVTDTELEENLLGMANIGRKHRE